MDVNPKYRVIHVPLGSMKRDDTPPQGAQPPRYNPEVDEPIFKRVWDKMAERKPLAAQNGFQADGDLFPPPPPGGFKLRGTRRKSIL